MHSNDNKNETKEETTTTTLFRMCIYSNENHTRTYPMFSLFLRIFFFFISSNWQSIWQFSRYFCRRWVVTTTHKSILIPLSTIFECRLLFASILFRYHFNSIWISARQIARASCKITNHNTIKYVCIFSIFEKPIYIILCIGSCFFIIFVALQCFW